jgi:D-glycero-D-manno-heptose 1,7-bisphosphate phosphatase
MVYLKGRAFFLDRDGVILRDPECGIPTAIHTISEAEPALRKLGKTDFKIIIVTNQKGVAMNQYSEMDVHKTHQRMNNYFRLNSIPIPYKYYFCPHHPDGIIHKYSFLCPCRKPQPGMLLKAAKECIIDLSKSWFIGDRMSDMLAGIAAGLKNIVLVRTGFGKKYEPEAAKQGICVVDHLLAAVNLCLTSKNAN